MKKKENVIFIYHAIVLYVPARNMPIKCYIYAKCVNYSTCIGEGSIAIYLTFHWHKPCDHCLVYRCQMPPLGIDDDKTTKLHRLHSAYCAKSAKKQIITKMKMRHYYPKQEKTGQLYQKQN